MSEISTLPPGMLNILDEAQLFDMLAYLISMADQLSPLFTPGGSHAPKPKTHGVGHAALVD